MDCIIDMPLEFILDDCMVGYQIKIIRIRVVYVGIKPNKQRQVMRVGVNTNKTICF
jgi:hypothetical protein